MRANVLVGALLGASVFQSCAAYSVRSVTGALRMCLHSHKNRRDALVRSYIYTCMYNLLGYVHMPVYVYIRMYARMYVLCR
jgi:hypothetical protein